MVLLARITSQTNPPPQFRKIARGFVSVKPSATGIAGGLLWWSSGIYPDWSITCAHPEGCGHPKCRHEAAKGYPGLARAEASATEYAVATVCGSMIAQGEACVKQAIIRFCGYPGWNWTGCTTKTFEIHEMAVAPCHCRAVTGGGCGNRRGLQGKQDVTVT